jgi:hypothetical protein
MPKGLMDFTERESLAPYVTATSVTVATATLDPCRAIYCGVAGNYEFNVNGSWVHFKAIPVGTILKISAIGARDQSDASAPAAGEIVFLY